MNVFEVRLTTQAEEQLRNIARYIAIVLNNPDAAESFIDLVDEKINSLSVNPEKYFFVDEEPWRTEEVRKVNVGNYLVYFWIDIENAAVQVTGIVHSSCNQEDFLKQMIIDY
ncbi:type II toxin-antitoxin system RelE/ParE family toxin [Butyrivibrio sp. AE3006]|uniref:type II toxin-antitoxin system RelE/ParE family toxin n=1 Tax=Butyrivibrio sp. AE3006 TaxID=1280673 RepID=UPI00047C63C3|nr:type II toxin-antitoxin system RelE/ParE family toxin [Butyrivibrio sp. AE3006]